MCMSRIILPPPADCEHVAQSNQWPPCYHHLTEMFKEKHTISKMHLQQNSTPDMKAAALLFQIEMKKFMVHILESVAVTTQCLQW